MRLVLALDTATTECAVGLGEWPADSALEPRVLGETNISTPRAALTHLVTTISRLLDECGRDVGEIGAVVVGRGPGSFTGVRIGIATAKGIASGLGVPLYGVGTIDSVAERFAARDGLVGVVGDAMRREVYPALFRCEAGRVRRLTPDTVCTPAEAAHGWAATIQETVVLAGEGLGKYAEVFAKELQARAEISRPPMWTPTGSSLLQAAWRLGVTSADGVAATVLPVYTRLSDAEEAEAKRAGRLANVCDAGVAGPSDHPADPESHGPSPTGEGLR